MVENHSGFKALDDIDMDGNNILNSGLLKFVVSDTEGSVASSVSETTIATVLIPANTVSTGIIVSAAIGVSGVTNFSTFRLKIGATGSENTIQTVPLWFSGDATFVTGGSMLFYDSTQTWTSDVTVLVTASNSQNGATNKSTCYQLVVTGF